MDNIKTVAIIGAGSLGTSLARTVAAANFDVIIIAKTKEKEERAVRRVTKILDKDVMKWRITESEKDFILSHIRFCSDIDVVSEADFVIEAITEDYEAKEHLFSTMDALCKPEVIFVTTTASLSITKLAAKISRSDKFIGMNFQLPVQRVPVVEVVSGLKTSDETRTRIGNFAKTLKKEVISVYEYPGYVTTRVILPFINEAMYVVLEGVASAEDVDKAMKYSYNLPRGPLAMADSIGLDTVLQWMEQLFHELGDLKYRPCPMLRKLVNAGHLGEKTGEGIFSYNTKED